jgi:hypothetical protein
MWHRCVPNCCPALEFYIVELFCSALLCYSTFCSSVDDAYDRHDRHDWMLAYGFAAGTVEWVGMVFSVEDRWKCPGFQRFLKFLVGYFQKATVIIAGDNYRGCYRRQPIYAYRISDRGYLSDMGIQVILMADFD